MIAKHLPKAGDRWPVNLSHCASGGDVSAWTDFTSWNFHNWSLYNDIVFQASTPSVTEAEAQSVQLNTEYTAFAALAAAHEREVAAFDAAVAGKPNLFASAAGGYVSIGSLPFTYRETGNPACIELRGKAPVAISAVKLTWGGRKTARAWYSLEWWDGARYNSSMNAGITSSLFPSTASPPLPPTVCASPFGATGWADMNGWNDQPLLTKVEAY